MGGGTVRSDASGSVAAGGRVSPYSHLMRTSVAACLILLAGCGSGTDPRHADPRVLVGEEMEFSMAALGGGEVQLVGGCLGAAGNVVVWPHGTRVMDREPLTIDVPGLGRVEVGQNVRLGGGFVVEHSEPGEVPDPLRVAGVTVPKSCAKHDVFLAATDQGLPG